MSSLKRTRWTKIVQMFLTVLLVFPFLLNVEKSAAGSLTSNASYQQTVEWTHSHYGLLPASWNQVDNYSVTYSYSFVSSKFPVQWKYVAFSPSTSPDYDLEWAIVIYDSTNPNSVISESTWFPVNTNINITVPLTQEGYVFRYKIYLRRQLDENGNRPQFSRSSINSCGVLFYGNLYQTLEQETLPSEWLETTTQTVVDSLETYTTIINGSDVPNYDDIDERLIVPHDVEVAVLHIFDVIGTIMSLKYMTFLVCFSIVMGLLVWLLH